MAASLADVNALFEQWHGQIVPRSFNAGFVTLSYVVSLIGAASTLELINRRTAPRGLFNNLLLISAAVTMGGIAIWCMHYIGNRAIDILDGQSELQIAFSSGFTALSFFVPILVLLAAFVAVGTDSKVAWWRITVGGTLAGAAICGMHYLGNASIYNYTCVYNAANVVGAALIAVAASIISLSLFFVFRAAWTNSWWKRIISAVVLAGAVSGMHWVASTGTQYKLISINSSTGGELSRNTTVIVVICLSLGACLVMAGTAIYTARIMKRTALKAQQVLLAAAVFDKQGRVLVSPDGLLPSERVTDSFFERTPQDSFTTAHPLFLWIFQASRNWLSITSIISGISDHLAHLPRNGRDNSPRSIKLITDHGDVIDNYDVIFKELFCAAAAGLADKLKSQLTSVGILWDEILPTGAAIPVHQWQDSKHISSSRETKLDGGSNTSYEDLAEKGFFRQTQHDIGRGSLMFLVRRAETSRDVESLEAAGYRFAELHQVSGIIASSMQIKSRNFEHKLRDMAAYAGENSVPEPGVHLGLFGVRARIGGGFDVLARKDAHNLLPSVQMPFARLESWQLDFLRQFDRCTPHALIKRLEALPAMTPREHLFAAQLADGIDALRRAVDELIFEESLLCPITVQVPCRDVQNRTSSSGTCTLIAFRAVMPIHLNVSSSRCELVPLSLFKVHQLVYRDSAAQLAFSRLVHKELSPIINAVPINSPSSGHGRIFKPMRSNARLDTASIIQDGPQTIRGDGANSPAGSQTESTYKLWARRGSGTDEEDLARKTSQDSESASPDSEFVPTITQTSESEPVLRPAEITTTVIPQVPPTALQQTSTHLPQVSFGGIMVSHQISVDVHDAATSSNTSRPSQGRSASRAGNLLPRLRRPSEGVVMGKSGKNGTSDGDGTEMRPIVDRSSVHVGAASQVSNVHADRSNDVATFVDELFAFCVDHR